VKILFDQNVPRNPARHLVGHQVTRSAELGWEELKNGALLKMAEENGFDLMITADRNLAYRQNLKDRKLAILVLPTGNRPILEPQYPAIVAAAESLMPGGFLDLAPRRSSRGRGSS
jgi:uncharacterized protein DUF5615